MNMKKILMVAAVLAGVTCFGAQNDTLLTFSTKGPDKYKDGTTVLDGECYALVWTKTGATFGGFGADGKLKSETDKLVLVASVAKGGCCPSTLFEISAKDAEQYEGGTFALYLLDTRVVGPKGVVVGAKSGVFSKLPKVATVSGFGAVAQQSSDTGSVTGDAGQIESYTELQAPTITAIELGEATITITVEGLVPEAAYFVVPGSTPTSFKPATKADQVGNKLTVERKDDESFFKVIGGWKK